MIGDYPYSVKGSALELRKTIRKYSPEPNLRVLGIHIENLTSGCPARDAELGDFSTLHYLGVPYEDNDRRFVGSSFFGRIIYTDA